MTEKLFEREACVRCLGSGRFAFKSVCYDCKGEGYLLTKRGQVAHTHYIKLLHMKAADLQPGMCVKVRRSGFDAGNESHWVELQSVKVEGGGYVQLAGVFLDGGEAWSGATNGHNLYRVAYTAEQKRLMLEAALSFQAMLTKDGRPSKRAMQRHEQEHGGFSQPCMA